MRRVKLVVSDFHLGAGRRNPDGSLNILEDFVFDERFLEFLEYHSTGDFTNAEVELIINGDFFNMIQCAENGAIPSDVTEETACRQLTDIMKGHPRVMDALKNFAEHPNRILNFTVGNHDSGLIFPQAKQLLKDALGEKIGIIPRAYAFDGVHIEHGDKYEPVHAIDPKRPYLSKGLEKPLLNLPWATYFYIHFVYKLKNQRSYIDKVKPFRNYLTWAAIYDFRFFLTTMTRLVFFTIWSMLFGRIGKKRFGLRLALTLLSQIEGNPEMRAAKRILTHRRNIHTVIFGHTHHPAYRQWRPGKEYFNTGCWNQMTNLDIERLGYHERLTYAYLKWDGKRWLTRLKRWRGTIRQWDEFGG